MDELDSLHKQIMNLIRKHMNLGSIIRLLLSGKKTLTPFYDPSIL